MKGLSVEVANFVHYHINQLHMPMVMRAFEMIELSGKQRYQEKYINLMEEEEDVDPTSMSDLIQYKVVEDLVSIIEAHDVHLNESTSYNIPLLTDVIDVLYKLQSLEDYNSIERIITTSYTNEYKLALMVNEITKVEVVVVLELLDEVEDTIFEQLVSLITKQNNIIESEEVETVTPEVSRTVVRYLDHVKGTPSVGEYLFKSGYGTHLTVCEMLDISKDDIKEAIESVSGKDNVLYAHNILSVLVVCCDSRDNPSVFFNENSSLFIDDLSIVGSVSLLINRMYGDFKNKLEEELRDENNN